MSGPPPKPALLRQRTNRKPGSATISALASASVPAIPNPNARKWHPLTLQSWLHAWQSPMASQWLDSDVDGLGRVALLWDVFYNGSVAIAGEIRLQEQRFGLSPLDRGRLQWEVSRGEEAEQKQRQKAQVRRTHKDPRAMLMAVK